MSGMDFDVDLETGQTVAFGLAMLSIGIWIGNQITGQLAYHEQMAPKIEGAPMTAVLEQPDWVGTVQSINQAVLVVFGICMIAILVADYYSRDEDERPTLEDIMPETDNESE